MIGIYIFYNLVYALFAFPLGLAADRIGLKRMYISGLFIFALVYLAMSFSTSFYTFILLFSLYGIYAAATDGISKAWISNITDKRDTATAIGTYSGFQSICAMLASTLAGLIWYRWGAGTAFLTTGIATIIIVLYLTFFVKTSSQPA